MRDQPSEPGEKEQIAALRKQVAGQSAAEKDRSGRGGIRIGIGDDCAVVTPPRGHELLVTTDFSLETLHFRREWHAAEAAGHRCLARGLSDLAAMGADPLAAFLSLALPKELASTWRERFLAGLLRLAGRFGVPLAGGDTAQSPRAWDGKRTGLALADIVLLGSCPEGEALLRSGAGPGDAIYVTGALGGAAAELGWVEAHPERALRLKRGGVEGPVAALNAHPHLFPEPRIAVGQWLRRNRRATAAIDVSDGLSTDLEHVCAESGVAAVVEADAIPVHPLAMKLAKDREAALDWALHGGEDYELLFTAPEGARVPLRIAGVPVTRIGSMRKAQRGAARVWLREGDAERPLEPGGWEHFR